MFRPEKEMDYKELPFYKKGESFGTFGNLCETLFPDFLDEIRLSENKWGAQGIGKLRQVLMHRPGEEVMETIELSKKDPEIARLMHMEDISPVYYKKTQRQFDDYVQVFKDEGVKVDWLNPEPPYVNWFGLPIPNISSIGLTLPNGGFIQERCGMIHKYPKHHYWYRRFAELGIPTLLTVTGKGIFEFPNVRWIDNKTCIIATSIRTNMEGINQVIPVLKRSGTEDIHIAHLPKSIAFHLDLVFGMADHDLGVVYPEGLDYYTIKYIENKGIRLIEASEKETRLCAPNLLALEPGKVIIPAGCPDVTKSLRKEGVEVIEVELDTFAPGSGPTCLPAVLIRDNSFPD